MSEAPFYFGMGIGAPDGLPSIAPLRTVEPRQKSATAGEMLMSRSQGGFGGQFGNWSPMSGRRIEQIRHFRLWNYIAISKVAEEASRHRPNVAFVKPHRPQGPQHKILLPGARRVDWNARLHRWSKSLHQIQPHEDVEPVGPDHPIERLFDRPNRWDKGGIHDILEELIIFLRLTGDGYLWAPPDDSGRPQELWCVPSTWVHGPRLDPKGGLWYFMLVPVVAGGSSATGMWFIPHDELIHFAYKNPWHKLLGLSPLQAASEWTDIQDSINFAEYASMKNGCFPTGVLELDKDMHDPDQADLERIYAKFFSRIQGESRFGRPILLAPGMTYNPLNISPEDMLYLESEDRIRDKLLSLHGVPKELVGIQDAGSEIAMYGPLKFFAMNTIGTLHARLARVLTHDLARRFDDSIRIWWDDTSVDNPESRRADIQLGLDKGLLTVDQACAMMGWQAQEIAGWSDVPLLPPTLLPMGEGGQQDGMGGFGGMFGEEDEEEEVPAKPARQPGEPKPDEPDGEEEPSGVPGTKDWDWCGVRKNVTDDAGHEHDGATGQFTSGGGGEKPNAAAPAGSVAAAESIARDAGVDLDAKGYAVLRKFFGAKRAATIPAMYLDSTKKVHLNERNAYWKNPADVAKKQHQSGWWSSDDPNHIVYHETGHAVQDKEGNLGRMTNAQFSSQAKAELGGKVSRYAMTQPKEFVAEVYAGLRSGKQYDDSVMKWYRAFYGPALPASEKTVDSLPEPVGVRPELQRALVAVANGEANGHAPAGSVLVPAPAPIFAPAPVAVAPVAPAPPVKRKRSRRAAGRKFVADLLDGWTTPATHPESPR